MREKKKTKINFSNWAWEINVQSTLLIIYLNILIYAYTYVYSSFVIQFLHIDVIMFGETKFSQKGNKNNINAKNFAKWL